MEEQSSRRRAKRPIRGPEAAEGNDTFFGQLLIYASLRECDGHDITESGEGDEHAEMTLIR